MRLIDADAMCADLATVDPRYDTIVEWCIRVTEAQPTVDAVEVVRCKDCKWWKTNYSWNGNEHKVCVREPYEPLRNAEDFCSYGERREDEVD